jgi:hypothetical protein
MSPSAEDSWNSPERDVLEVGRQMTEDSRAKQTCLHTWQTASEGQGERASVPREQDSAVRWRTMVDARRTHFSCGVEQQDIASPRRAAEDSRQRGCNNYPNSLLSTQSFRPH